MTERGLSKEAFESGTRRRVERANRYPLITDSSRQLPLRRRHLIHTASNLFHHMIIRIHPQRQRKPR